METYLTKREAADMLKTTERTIDRWRRDRKLNAVFVGPMTRFKLSDIEKMVSADAPPRTHLFGRALAAE
jgi:excisionase family DNA binding protein